MRPSLVVLDDPQTDESARSLSQCATREGILAGAILGLAGPGKKISGIMPVHRDSFLRAVLWAEQSEIPRVFLLEKAPVKLSFKCTIHGDFFKSVQSNGDSRIRIGSGLQSICRQL